MTTTSNQVLQSVYFDKLALNHPADTINATPAYNKQAVLQCILSQPLKGNTLLDFGCGDGVNGYTEFFLENNFEVTFTDISTQAVSLLESRLSRFDKSQYHAISGPIENNLPKLTGKTFDIVFFGDTFHHLTFAETLAILNILKQYMHEQSHIIAIEPNGHYPLWRWMHMYNKDFVWEVEKNIRFCTPKHFADKFRQSGLKLDTYRYQRFLPLFMVEHSHVCRAIDQWFTTCPLINRLSPYSLISGSLEVNQC